MIAHSERDDVPRGRLLRSALLLDPVDGIQGLRDILIGSDGRITSVSSPGAMKRATDGVPELDLGGRATIPGLTDTHFHVMATALAARAIALGGASSLAEIQDRLRSASPTVGAWVTASGYEDALLPADVTLDRASLDVVCPDVPAMVEHRSLHFAVVNSEALRRLGADTAREAGDGGRLRGARLASARQQLVLEAPPADRLLAMREVADQMASRGVTTIGAVEGGELFGDVDIAVMAAMPNDFPVSTVLYWVNSDAAAAAKMGLRQLGGDLLLDGTLGSRTAALHEPYADDPSTSGVLHRSQDDVDEFFRACVRNGLQPSVHAIGGRAIEQALRAIEGAMTASERFDYRPRIDHFGEPTRDQILRAADLGVAVASQPPFAFVRGAPGEVYERRLGASRVARTYPFRWLVDAGIRFGAGSDSPVVPNDPWLGIHGLVNGHYESQRLTALEALAAYTTEAAWVDREDAMKGVIREGYEADLAVLDTNILEAPAGRLRETQVLLTIRRGSITWDAGSISDLAAL